MTISIGKLVCPNCGKLAEFTEHKQRNVETHGLECGPYEIWEEQRLTCEHCGAECDDGELSQVQPENPCEICMVAEGTHNTNGRHNEWVCDECDGPQFDTCEERDGEV